ncbi:radical SAM protein [Piscinibacter sakaiensis]|uniref:Radical SAM core domain-containing protein n=1 Tax=Piscinibacter sakaiensis TaxID=1547922 RepID=A0A0K8NXL7_PISS1|nr:radical SAM protein [Piscinibacter sakaiensis]GAP35123.1 hypothetical protein ISF6_0694 [Piscinibacter sakaiensis]
MTAAAAPFVQVELTTVCNYACVYCAGRAMPQRHMDDAVFADVLRRLPAGPPGGTVSLQGEGEPTLHPRFWALVDAVQAHGWTPYTITNGTRVEPARFAAAFPRLGVSVDTLDEALSARIGRPHLAKVLANLDALCAALGPARLIVHSVDLGQPLGPLRAWLAARGIAHEVQPLQRKPDYRRHYPAAAAEPALAAVLPGLAAADPAALIGWARPPRPRRCDYLERPRMRFFTIDGVELPCCFIKDVPPDFSAEATRAALAAGRLPATCAGCRMLD